MNLRTIILFSSLLSMLIMMPSCRVYSQQQRELTTSNSRARRAFEEAIKKYNQRDLRGAEAGFRDAVRHDPNFIEAYIIMGEIFEIEKRYQDAALAWENAVRINPGFFPNILYNLGDIYLIVGEYGKAQKSLLQFIGLQNINPAMRERAGKNLQRVEFALNAVRNPLPFEPRNLGAGVNSEHEEYAPALTADEQTLIFTRKRPREDRNYLHLGSEFEDFYVSQRVNGVWGPAVNLGPPINSQNNEGAQSISADGIHLYFTGCSRPGGIGSCDIYYSRKAGSGWSAPVNLGPPVNTSAWESQPSVSPDGKTLFFTSNRRHNYGQMDIWTSTLSDTGRWSDPVNLGPVINTAGKEMSPFIHPDNKTLYFASDGHTGMGGIDLYYSVRDLDGNWQQPINLGYPINTYVDEISLIVGASGREAYFASEQPGGFGKTDIYYFELYEDARPEPVTYMKGIVFDAQTRRRLEARFELINLSTGQTILQSLSNPGSGEFLIPIPTSANLALNVWRDGYLFFSENFSFSDVRTGIDPPLYDIPLQPIRAGESVVLRNIFFETDSHELLPQSAAELNKLHNLLVQNPAMRIELSGHTDNTGSFAHNKALSERRALSVYNFLADKGIDRRRLTYAGYADSKPIADNASAEGRAQNRRTEFKVLENN